MIKELPIHERPREKALLQGVASLSDAELLAIILRGGYKNCNVLNLATQLLDNFRGLYFLLTADEKELMKIKGLNKIKILELKAVLQIVIRIKSERVNRFHPAIHSGYDVYQFYHLSMELLQQEKAIFIGLNSKNQIIKEETLFIGSEKEMTIDRRIICKKALDLNASKVILIHNHPSGDSMPSIQDIKATEYINEALKMINIKLLDHIIIGKGEYYSLLDQLKFTPDK